MNRDRWYKYDGAFEDLTRCVKEIGEPPRYIHWHQCKRKRGHGPEGFYCKQHAKQKEEGLAK